jgi:hypothetical protein
MDTLNTDDDLIVQSFKDKRLGKLLACFMHNPSYGVCSEFLMDTSDLSIGLIVREFKSAFKYAKENQLIKPTTRVMQDAGDTGYDLTFTGLWVAMTFHQKYFDDCKKYLMDNNYD